MPTATEQLTRQSRNPLLSAIRFGHLNVAEAVIPFRHTEAPEDAPLFFV
jgi:hypothetical protein